MKKNRVRMGAASLFTVLLAVFVLALAGCGGKKEKAPAGKTSAAAGKTMPANHPSMEKAAEAIAKASHSTIKTSKKVVLSKEVLAKWKEVKLQITDNASKESASVKLKVGTTVKLTDDGYRLKVEYLVPDYSIVGNRIESRSNEPKNPAVLVSLLKEDKTVARGWVFKKLPESNSYNNKRFDLKLQSP